MSKYGLVRIFSVGPAGRYRTFASKHKLYENKGGAGGKWEIPRKLTPQRFLKREGTRNLLPGRARNRGSAHVICCEICDYQDLTL
jgi:hypothetical protein